VAAHWKYKEDPAEPTEKSRGRKPTRDEDGSQSEMVWLRQMLDWQQETEDPGDFLESLRFDLGPDEVYVFTPRGDVKGLPVGSTPVDFAYSIHTEVGNRCIGARVNGRLVPLESPLDNGDVVEVFTSKAPGAGPSRDWLSFVKSPRARTKIRQWFTKERREEAIEKGKETIALHMRKEGLPLQRLLTHDSLQAVAETLHVRDVSSLYAAVGEGNVGAQNVVRKVIELHGGDEGSTEDLAEAVTVPTEVDRRRRVRRGDAGVMVHGANDLLVKLARCCTPVPGDDIVGFVTRGSGVSVHRGDCPNVKNLTQEPERLVDVEWAPNAQSVFLVAIQVEALDRARLLSDVTRVLSDHHVNILSATLQTGRDRVAKSKFTFEMGDPKHLGHVLKAVRSVDGVFDVYRVTQ
jgi:GTP diphosphokinase / guanosine-3',5'-bis(diphosphate) 3'-diphosphatase